MTEPHINHLSQGASASVPVTPHTPLSQDTAITLESPLTSSSFQEALSRHKHIPAGITLTITLPSGTALFSPPVIEGFYGGGKIIIMGSGNALNTGTGAGPTTIIEGNQRWVIQRNSVQIEMKKMIYKSTHANSMRLIGYNTSVHFENVFIQMSQVNAGFGYCIGVNSDGSINYNGEISFNQCRLESQSDYIFSVAGYPKIFISASVYSGGVYNYRWFGAPTLRESAVTENASVANILKSISYSHEV